MSSAEHTRHRDSQAGRLVAYGRARGYHVAQGVNEVGAGVNARRPKRLALRDDQGSGLIVVEHQDRLPRCGFRSLDPRRTAQDRAVAVVHHAEHGTEALLWALTASVYAFCARLYLYGQRRAKRQTDGIVREVEAQDAQGEAAAPG